MILTRLLAVSVSIALFALASGCTSLPGARPGDGKKEVEISIVGPMTGDLAVIGQSYEEGVRLAFDKVNAAGGVNGVTFRLATYDDRNNQTEATNVARKIAGTDSVLAVIGHYSSGTVFAAQGIYDQAKIPHFTPSASHPDLTKNGRYTFRMWSSIDEYQPQGAEYSVKQLGLKRQAIIYVNNDWGKSSFTAWTNKLKELGGEVVLAETVLDGDKDFKSQLAKVQGSGADGLAVLTFYPEGALIVSQARGMGLTMPIAGSATFLEPEFVKIAGDAANGIAFNTEFHKEKPEPSVQEFVKLFKEKYPDKEIALYHPTAYDAAQLIIEGVKAAGPDREKVYQAIVGLKEYPGVTGKYTFGEAREPKKTNVFVRINNGKFEYAGG
jgi:branched-chain amino acid transport system substrate-binding protein